MIRESARPNVFWPLAAIALPPLGLLVKLRVHRRDLLPQQGAFVLAPNHYSEIDPLITAVAVFRTGRLPRFMAKESLFKVPVLGWILKKTGMIPVQRASTRGSAQATLQHAEALAASGRGVIVYPEGTLTRDPDLWPMRGKTGAVRLALEANVPLIPAAGWGAQEVLPRYGKMRFWPLRKRVDFVIGEPIDLSDLVGHHNDQATLALATDRLMAAVSELLAELRGEKAPDARWDPSKHQQKETGRFED